MSNGQAASIVAMMRIAVFGTAICGASRPMAQTQATATTVATPQPIYTQGSTVPMLGLVNAAGLPPTGSVSFIDGATVLQTVAVLARSGTNILPYSTSGSAWTLQGAGVIVPESALAPDGTDSGFTVQYSGSSDTFITQSAAPVDPLKPYIFSVWLRTTSGTLTTGIEVQDQTAAGIPHQIVVTTSWQRFSVVGYLTYQATQAQVMIGGSGSLGPSVTPGNLQVWGAQLERVSPGPYAATSGTAVQSGSGTNLLPYSTAGNQWDVWGDGWTSDSSDLNYVPDIDPDGTYHTSLFTYQGDATSGLTYDMGNQVGSLDYVFSVWLRVPGTVPVNTHINLLSNSGVVRSNAITITTAWTRFSVTGTVGAGSDVTAAIGEDGAFGPNVLQGSVDFWGGQFEQGTATSGPYVWTSGTPRSASLTNLLPYSSSLSGWTTTGTGSLSVSSDLDPMGTATAVSAQYFSTQNLTLVQASTATDLAKAYTFSVWLRVPSGTFDTSVALFDQNGSVVTQQVALTTNWKRFSVTGYLLSSSTALKVGIGSMAAGGQCPQGGSGGSFEIFGAQLEPVEPSGYIATSGVPASGGKGMASFSTSSLSVGTHEITAAYSGDNYSTASTSSVLPVTITGAQATPAMSLGCSPNIIDVGGAVTCTAQLAAGSIGNVTFALDGGTWTTVMVSSSGAAIASQATNTLHWGVHEVTASYTGYLSTLNQTLSTLSQTANIVVVSPNLPATPPNGNVVYSYLIVQDGSNTSLANQSGYDGAGNIVGYNDSINGTWSAAYDNLNRLITTTAQIGATAQYMCWNYDSFGNRLSQSLQTTPCAPYNPPTPTNPPYLSNNQLNPLNGYQYDAAGNLIDDGIYYYVYDAAGRMCASTNHAGGNTVTGYLYDADGTRIAKGTLSIPSGSALACPTAFAATAFQPTTTYLSGPGGEPMAEFAGGTIWTRSYIYSGEGMLASQDLLGIHLNLSDWLGTRRVQTDYVGTTEASFRNNPFGDSMVTVGADSASQHFTGKERDAETGSANGNDGLDYFEARYYASSMGRFTSPDPNFESSERANPQTWNRYDYALSNPLRFTDPSGECWVQDSDAGGGGTGTWSWENQAHYGQTCVGEVAQQEGDNLQIYGPSGADDKQTFTPDAQGYINMEPVAQTDGAFFSFKPGANTYASAQTGADLYNASYDYHNAYPTDDKLVITDIGKPDGANFGQHKTHNLGRSVDFRYMGANGKPVPPGGKLPAIWYADDARMQAMTKIFQANGFDQNYSDDNNVYGTQWAAGHDTHIHFGKDIRTAQCEIGPCK